MSRIALWTLLILLAVGGALFAKHFFPQAFPVVSLDIRMDRDGALQSAGSLARVHGWGPRDYRQAASFALDRDVQNFIELEVGGSRAFRELLQSQLYQPYTWRVRHFAENTVTEALIRFTPGGERYGFVLRLPEDDAGPSLPADSARAIAETAAREDWAVDWNVWELVAESEELRPGGRSDHAFTYERPNERIGDGRYRLRLVVSGDRLTELTRFIKIPEAFARRYEEMRSANKSIAGVGMAAMVILYILGGCIIGLLLLLRQRWVMWRRALLWAVAVAGLQVLARINEWPLGWMSYDTALSLNTYRVQELLELLLLFCGDAVLLMLIFTAAESLSRRAFGHHIRLWRMWEPGAASSPEVLGRTLGGYLVTGFSAALVIAIYLVNTRLLGWWTPSAMLFEPDIMATHLPWFGSLATSLHAGFMEECLFRAVPLAAAALIGDRFGHRRAWIGLACALQAVVFGAAHATYASHPAYVRLVELILPSLLFAGIYLRYGLLPAILLHFAFDVAAFALPLFMAATPGAWLNRLLVIVLALIPLWVVAAAIIIRRGMRTLGDHYYNWSWEPPHLLVRIDAPAIARPTGAIGRRTMTGLSLAAALGVVLWGAASDLRSAAPPLDLSRAEAESRARTALAARGIELPAPWRTLSAVETPLGIDDRFVWQTGGRQAYAELITGPLAAPRWKVRFVRFEGDIAERAHEHQVYLTGNGEIARLRHLLPEHRMGATLEEADARAIVAAHLREAFGKGPGGLEPVAAEPLALPQRRDWVLTYADTVGFPLAAGEARLSVRLAGERVSDAYRYLHVPEEWERSERNRRKLTGSLQGLGTILLALILAAGIIAGLVRWGRGRFAAGTFTRFLILMLALRALAALNGWPAIQAGFSTAEPFGNQVLLSLAFTFLGVIAISSGAALAVGFIHSWAWPRPWSQGLRLAWAGVAAGMFAAGVQVLLQRAAPALEPNWGDYRALDASVPVLAVMRSALERYVTLTIVVLLGQVAAERLTEGGRRQRVSVSAGMVLLGLLISSGRIADLNFWLIEGSTVGLMLLAGFWLVFRHQPALVPLATLPLAVAGALKQAAYGVTPVVLPGAALAVLACSALAVYWARRLAGEPGAKVVPQASGGSRQ